MEKSVKANHNKIMQLLRQNRRKLADDDFAVRQDYAAKIGTLSEKVFEYCSNCKETSDFQKMLMELAEDLPKNANPQQAVHRSIQKRFKTIIKHLQGTHGLSVPRQFQVAGIVIGASMLGMAGFVIMAFNMNFLFPVAGLFTGGLLGYLWGVSKDRKAEEAGTVIDWKE